MTTATSGSAKEGELRQRAAKSASKTSADDSTNSKTHSTRELDTRPSSLGLDILRGLVGLVLLAAIGSYVVNNGETYTWYVMDPTRRPWFLSPAQIRRHFEGPLLLTNDQLAAYDGSEPGTPIYVALNRTIYDVSASPHVYGPGGMYSTLAAKDASRSYITTCFDPVEDLVPYFGGVEEIYVPLWLSRRTPKQLKPELDAIALGELVKGKDTEDLMEDIRRKVGRKNVKIMQKEAYEEAKEKVRAQVRTWEGMFENKNYPIVGKVIGVDEEDDKKWRHLGFCDAALKMRQPMAESLQRAMELAGKGGGAMPLNMMGGKPKTDDEAERKRKKAKAKKAKKAKEQADKKKAGTDTGSTDPEVLDEELSDHGDNDKANVKIEDMLKGGKYYGTGDEKKVRKIEEIMRDGAKRGDKKWAEEVVEKMKDTKVEHGEDPDVEIPDAVPVEVLDDGLNDV